MLVFGILTGDHIHGAFYKEMYGHLAGLKKKTVVIRNDHITMVAVRQDSTAFKNDLLVVFVQNVDNRNSFAYT